VQYRNLYRVFTFNKAVKAWGKDSGVDLSDGQINVLIALSTGDNMSFVQLRDYLKRFNRGLMDTAIMSYLKTFVGLGYVEVFGYWPVRYRLTIDGINALNGLEQRCRDTRYDK
jgi:hypothetical protein